VRKAARGLSGEEQTRALRRAYMTLGLSSSGAFSYSPREIESQLEWSLRTGRADALQLWVAYAYIREFQHPALRDPWGSASLGGCGGTAHHPVRVVLGIEAATEESQLV